MYYLGNAFWPNAQERAANDTGKATVSERAERLEPGEPDASA